MSSREKLAEFMAKRGRSFTQHQEVVADAIFAEPGTFNAAKIAAILQGKISRATVFRVLNLFAKADVLRQVRFNGTDVFVITADD
jgi:Fe2+ or Zn2+ uptake regulation protein